MKYLGDLRLPRARGQRQPGLNDVTFDQFDPPTRVWLGEGEPTDRLGGQRRPPRLDQAHRSSEGPIGQQSR